MTISLDALVTWIAYEAAHTTDVSELAASDAVRLAAHLTGWTPHHVAVEVSRVLSKAQETQRRYRRTP